jgi:hypothetical protein
MKPWTLIVAACLLGLAAGTGFTWWEFHAERIDVASLRTSGNEGRPGGAPIVDPAAPAPGIVVVGGEEFNFGVMERNAVRRHTFVIRNTGQGVLRLTQGGTSCSACTISELSRSEVPPGESAEVTVEWSPKSFTPTYRQTATIRTNDPSRPVVLLAIVGRVTQTVRLMPDDIALGNISASTRHTLVVRLFGYRDDSLALASHEWLNAQAAEYFELRAEPLSADELKHEEGANSGLLLTIEIKPGLPVGAIRQRIRLVTSLDDVEPLELSLAGKVVGDITLLPTANVVGDGTIVALGAVPQSTGTKAEVYLLLKGPLSRDVELSIGETFPAGVLRASLGERTEVKLDAVYKQKLTLEIPAGSPTVDHLGTTSGEAGRLGRVVIETTHPVTTRVVVHVQFAVAGAAN